MATEYLAEGTTFTDIADAIREKEASAESIAVTEMAERIEALTVGVNTSDATAEVGDI